MTRPTKHPKTGVFQVRKSIPENLRAMAKATLGVSHELKVSLGTKDEREALRQHPAALATIEAKLESLRSAAAVDSEKLTERQVHALAGNWYLAEIGRYQDNPGSPEQWEGAIDWLMDQAEIVPDDPDDRINPGHSLKAVPSEDDRAAAASVIIAAGLPLSPNSIERVSNAISSAKFDLYTSLRARASGDWSPDPNLAKFPPLPAPAVDKPAAMVTPPSETSLTFDDLLAGWARDHGHSLKANPISRALYDRKRTLERLSDFLGHRDAAKVTVNDAVRWKEDMQTRELSVLTVRNDLSEMSALWKHALSQRKLGSAGINPFAGISPPKPKRKKKQRRAFTQDEAVQILIAAREQKGYLRWLPWVCCLTGARLSEICQSYKEDVTVIDGVHVLRIDDEGDEDSDQVRSLKNEDSRRNVPIHPALIAEGFLDYVESLPGRSPLFPDAPPDKVFGLRATSAGRKISRWMKQDLKLTDSRISPNHSWRHWFIDACRSVAMNPEVRSALTGHSARMDESSGYGDGVGKFVHLLAEAIAKVPSPL